MTDTELRGRAEQTTPPPKADNGESNGVPWRRLFGIATVIVAVYLGFAVLAFTRAGDGALPEVVWSRSAWVVHGVEALAFTAVGWLFGREVHRGEAQEQKQHAKDATERADSARQETGDARERAAAAEHSGRALAEAVRATTGGAPAGSEDGGNESAAAGADPRLRALASMADRMFPPR